MSPREFQFTNQRTIIDTAKKKKKKSPDEILSIFIILKYFID